MIRTRSIPALMLTACLSATPTTAHAQELAAGWTICMRDLTLVETIVERGDENGIVTVNEFGIRKLIPLGDIFFAVPTKPLPTPVAGDVDTVPMEQRSPVRLISLTDGQVLRGSIVNPPEPETLAYRVVAGTSMHGDGQVSLERVRSVGDEPYALLVRDRDGDGGDRVTTRTGDVLTGFIESIGAQTTISASTGKITLDSRRVQSMLIANPPQTVPGVYIATDDGLRVRADSFDFDFQQPMMVTVDAPSLGMDTDARTTWIFDPGAVRGIDVVRQRARVVSLTGIAPERVEAVGSRDWTPSPTVMLAQAQHAVLGSIDLHAPLRVVYPLPRGSTRFACELTGVISTWTDCVARVTSVAYNGTRTELLSQRINAKNPGATVNAELGEGTARIEFEIDPGAYGPIQDRVIVGRPRVVVSE